MTETMLSQVKVAEMTFLRRVHGVALRDEMRSCEICKTLNVERLLRIERSKLRRLSNLPRTGLRSWCRMESDSSVGNSCWNGTISFQTFIETDNCCFVPRLPLIACCDKIVDSQTSFTLRQGVGNFGKVEVGSRTFFRLHNPEKNPAKG